MTATAAAIAYRKAHPGRTRSARTRPGHSRRDPRALTVGGAAGYDGTQTDRHHRGWNPASTDPLTFTGTHLELLVRRSRDLARKAPQFVAAIDTLVDNVIGDGIRITPQVYTGDDPDSLDAALNRQLYELWREATELGLDLDRRESFDMIARLQIRELIEGGEALQIHSTLAAGGPVPLVLEVLPTERLPQTLSRAASPSNPNRNKRNRISQGIEFTRRGARAAYWIYNLDGSGVPTYTTTRVPEDRVNHLFRRLRAGQERGLPWLYGAMILAADLDDLMDSELTSAQVASCLTGWIEREQAGVLPTAAETDTDTDRPIYRFDPGMIGDLRPGEKINIVDPNRPSGAFEPFANFITRSVAKSLGISFESLSGDYRQVNYASGRLGHMAERGTFRRIQGELIQIAARPAWVSFVRHAVLAGKLPISVEEYVQHPERYTRAEFSASGWEHADPKKGIDAAERRIAANLSTRTRESALLGTDFHENVRTNAREEAEIAAAGLDAQAPETAGSSSSGGSGGQPGSGEPDLEDTLEELLATHDPAEIAAALSSIA